MSSPGIDFQSIQNVIKTINKIADSINSVLSTSIDVPSTKDLTEDIDTGEKDTSDWIKQQLQNMENEAKQTQAVTSNASTHRTYEVIHRYIYSKPSKSIGIPEFAAEHILVFVDKAMSQINAVMSILPQLTGSPLDFNRWASGVRTLAGVVLDFLPYLKEAQKAVENFDRQSVSPGRDFDRQSVTSGRDFDRQSPAEVMT